MTPSRSLRRFVAGAVAVLFLACQGTAGVYAGVRDLQQPGAAGESCHDPGQKQPDRVPVKNDCQVNCASQVNSVQPGATILDSIDLPPVLVLARGIVAPPEPVSRVEPRLLRVEPPPLPILHCCLRN